jgi:hypothetical protein
VRLLLQRDEGASGWGKVPGFVGALLAGALALVEDLEVSMDAREQRRRAELVRLGRGLVERGRSAKARRAAELEASASPRPRTVAERLRTLAALRDEGLIAGEAFARAVDAVLPDPAAEPAPARTSAEKRPAPAPRSRRPEPRRLDNAGRQAEGTATLRALVGDALGRRAREERRTAR